MFPFSLSLPFSVFFKIDVVMLCPCAHAQLVVTAQPQSNVLNLLIILKSYGNVIMLINHKS